MPFTADLLHMSGPLQIRLVASDLVPFCPPQEIWEMVSYSTAGSFPGLLLSAGNVENSSIWYEQIQGC